MRQASDRSRSDAVPCAERGPDLWFAEAPADLERAKSLCRGCRLHTRCLDGALQRREPWGVWGGEILLDGLVVPAKRRRGRPPKVRAHRVGGAAGASSWWGDERDRRSA